MLFPSGLFRNQCEGFVESAVKSLDHAVGLRPKWTTELVAYLKLLTHPVNEVFSRGFTFWFMRFFYRKAVCKLAAIVG